MKTFDTKWEEIHQVQQWGKYPSEEVIRFYARNYQSDRAETKVLDLGCGGGAHTWYLAKEGFDTYAVDGSETAIEKTLSLIESMGLTAYLSVSDISELSYEDNFFDSILDSAVIYANTKVGIESIITECYRVLRPGGSIFSTGNFNSNTTGYGTGELIEENTYINITEGGLSGRGTVHFFDSDELRATYENAGFKVISLDILTRTDHNGAITISYHMLHARKL